MTRSRSQRIVARESVWLLSCKVLLEGIKLRTISQIDLQGRHRYIAVCRRIEISTFTCILSRTGWSDPENLTAMWILGLDHRFGFMPFAQTRGHYLAEFFIGAARNINVQQVRLGQFVEAA